MIIKPFQLKIGGKTSGWRALVNGKVADLGDKDATEEQAQQKLNELIAKGDQTPTGPTIGQIADKVGIPVTKAKETPTFSSPKEPEPSDDKARPGEIRKNGLADLSPALLKKFRETFAASVADANYSADKALFSIFGYAVEDIPEETKGLLKIGWELACQQYFVDGVPPPWVIILFANAQIIIKLAANAKEKKPTNGTSNQSARNNGTGFAGAGSDSRNEDGSPKD
jgi:hypothetical protein